MPKVTLYIREADFEKWKQLENKSEAISSLLNGEIGVPTSRRTPPIRMPFTEGDGTKTIKEIPVKNNSVGKPTKRNICPQHLVDKDTCKLMKHTA